MECNLFVSVVRLKEILTEDKKETELKKIINPHVGNQVSIISVHVFLYIVVCCIILLSTKLLNSNGSRAIQYIITTPHCTPLCLLICTHVHVISNTYCMLNLSRFFSI